MKFLSTTLCSLLFLSSCGVPEKNHIHEMYLIAVKPASTNTGRIEVVPYETSDNEQDNKKPYTKYRYQSSGYKPGSEHTLWLILMDTRRSNCYGTFRADEKGELIYVEGGFLQPGMPLSSMMNVRGSFMRGEPVFIFTVGKNSSETFTGIYHPNPIEFTWEDGAQASVVLKDINGEYFFFHGEGFLPGEEINCETLICGEADHNTIVASENGSWTELRDFSLIEGNGSSVAILIKRAGHKPGVLKFFCGKAVRNTQSK